MCIQDREPNHRAYCIVQTFYQNNTCCITIAAIKINWCFVFGKLMMIFSLFVYAMYKSVSVWSENKKPKKYFMLFFLSLSISGFSTWNKRLGHDVQLVWNSVAASTAKTVASTLRWYRWASRLTPIHGFMLICRSRVD